MPKKVIIDQEIIEIDNNPEILRSQPVNNRDNKKIIFEGGIGRIKDLLYRDQILIARTDLGWYFSENAGRDWKTETEREDNLPSFFHEKEILRSDIKAILREYVKMKPELTDNSDPNLSDWLEEETPCRVDFLQVNSTNEFEIVIDEFLKILSERKFKEFLVISSHASSSNLAEQLFRHHADNTIRTKKLLDNVVNESIILSELEISNLFILDKNLKRAKMMYNIKTVIITDINKMFEKDKSLEFIDSALNYLCETCYLLNIRIIAFVNLERRKTLAIPSIFDLFRNPFSEWHLVQFNHFSGITDIKSIDVKEF